MTGSIEAFFLSAQEVNTALRAPHTPLVQSLIWQGDRQFSMDLVASGWSPDGRRNTQVI